MSFASPLFLWIFTPVVLGLILLCPRSWRNGIIALASLVFYTVGAGPTVILLLFAMGVNFLAGQLLEPDDWALARRRKRGMTAPRQRWLRGPLPEFAADALSPERLRATGYFDAAAVSALLGEHRASRVNAGDLLLGVLGVQLWDSMFMHGALRPPATASSERRVVRAATVGGCA